jgi:hypothetical protein
LAADRVNYYNRQQQQQHHHQHHHRSSIATNNNSENKLSDHQINEGLLYSNLIKSPPSRSLSTTINLNNQQHHHQSNRIPIISSQSSIPLRAVNCADQQQQLQQQQQKQTFDDMRRRSASEKPQSLTSNESPNQPMSHSILSQAKPVTVVVVDEEYQTKIEDLSVSPPNSYLRKKQINNNNNNNITTSLNEINKILNNNNGALIVDEIPITIQFDTSTKQQTNVDAAAAAAASLNNYKKPIAIQNQFLKMQQQITAPPVSNSGLKPSIRQRYSTDLAETVTSPQIVKPIEIGDTSKISKIEINNKSLPFVYDESSLSSLSTATNTGDTSPSLVVMPRANRRKQKPFTIECNSEEIREIPTPPTTPRKKDHQITAAAAVTTTTTATTTTSSTLTSLEDASTKQSLNYSNLSLKYIDEASITCGSAPLSPELAATAVVVTSSSSNKKKEEVESSGVESPLVINKLQETKNSTDSSEPVDDEEEEEEEENASLSIKKQLKKRKHRNVVVAAAANSKESIISKHSLDNIDDIVPSIVASAVVTDTSGVNLPRSSEVETSMTLKQIRNKERRDRRQRHTLPLVNREADAAAAALLEKNSQIIQTGSSNSIQIQRQDSVKAVTTSSSSDEDKERHSRKNLKPKSSSFRRKINNNNNNNDTSSSKATTPHSSNKLLTAAAAATSGGINLPIDKEIKVEHVTSSPSLIGTIVADDNLSNSINKVIEWENENLKQRDSKANEDTNSKKVSRAETSNEAGNTLVSEEENTFKSTGYYNNNNNANTINDATNNINNTSLMDESDLNNLSTNDLENLNEAAEIDTTTDASTTTTKAASEAVAAAANADTLSLSSNATATVIRSPKHKLTIFNAKSDTETSNFDEMGLNANRNRYSIGSNTSDMFIRSLRRKHDSTDTLDSASSYEIRFERPRDDVEAAKQLQEKLDEKNHLWNIKNAAAAAKLAQSPISEMKESPSLLLASDFKEEIPVDSCLKLVEEQTPTIQAKVVVRDENSGQLVSNKLVVNEPVEIKVGGGGGGGDVVSVMIKEMINTVNSELENETTNCNNNTVEETQTNTQMNTEDFSNVESSISDCEKVESMSESEENILKEKKLLYPLTDDSYNLLSNTSSQINIEDSQSSHNNNNNCNSEEMLKIDDIITETKLLGSNLTSSSEVSPRFVKNNEESSLATSNDDSLLQSQSQASTLNESNSSSIMSMKTPSILISESDAGKAKLPSSKLRILTSVFDDGYGSTASLKNVNNESCSSIDDMTSEISMSSNVSTTPPRAETLLTVSSKKQPKKLSKIKSEKMDTSSSPDSCQNHCDSTSKPENKIDRTILNELEKIKIDLKSIEEASELNLLPPQHTTTTTTTTTTTVTTKTDLNINVAQVEEQEQEFVNIIKPDEHASINIDEPLVKDQDFPLLNDSDNKVEIILREKVSNLNLSELLSNDEETKSLDDDTKVNLSEEKLIETFEVKENLPVAKTNPLHFEGIYIIACK